jgi:hypothetical protein
VELPLRLYELVQLLELRLLLQSLLLELLALLLQLLQLLSLQLKREAVVVPTAPHRRAAVGRRREPLAHGLCHEARHRKRRQLRVAHLRCRQKVPQGGRWWVLRRWRVLLVRPALSLLAQREKKNGKTLIEPTAWRAVVRRARVPGSRCARAEGAAPLALLGSGRLGCALSARPSENVRNWTCRIASQVLRARRRARSRSRAGHIQPIHPSPLSWWSSLVMMISPWS